MSRRKPPKVPSKKLMYASRHRWGDGEVREGRLYTRPGDAVQGSGELVVYELTEVAVLPGKRPEGNPGVRLKDRPKIVELVAGAVEARRVG